MNFSRSTFEYQKLGAIEKIEVGKWRNLILRKKVSNKNWYYWFFGNFGILNFSQRISSQSDIWLLYLTD